MIIKEIKTPIPVKTPKLLIGKMFVIERVKKPVAVVNEAKNMAIPVVLITCMSAFSGERPELKLFLYDRLKWIMPDMDIAAITGGIKLEVTSIELPVPEIKASVHNIEMIITMKDMTI